MLIRFFFFSSSGIILLITALAKIVSAFGNSAVLNIYDPVFAITFRKLLLISSLIEIIVGLISVWNKNEFLKACLLASLSVTFLSYRFELWWIGYRRYCPCLGTLTDALHIPPQTADTVMKIILAYLLIGSYATLFWLWRQKRQAVLASASSGTSAPSSVP
jgi:hypothetical protein